MPRVKGGYTQRRRHKKILKLAKGYYGSKHTLYRTANGQVMKSLTYAYRDRKDRKRQFRKLWISRINAACKLNDMKYSRFISGLTKAGVIVNRKMLAEMAVNDAAGFAALVETAKANANNAFVKADENVVFLKREKKAVVLEKLPAEQASAPAKPVVEKVEVKKEEPKKVEPKKVVKEEKAVAEDLSSKNVAELKALCKERGIKGYSALKKAELIKALQ